MKNLFHFTIACFACAFSLSAQDDQISYSYDQSQTSSQAVEVSKAASGQGFSVVLHTKALPSMGSPEEIFAELNKLISQKTVVPLEQRYPGVHFKVKDEELEYDKPYLDQSEDGKIRVLRIKVRGEVIEDSKLGETIVTSGVIKWKLEDDELTVICFPTVDVKIYDDAIVEIARKRFLGDKKIAKEKEVPFCEKKEKENLDEYVKRIRHQTIEHEGDHRKVHCFLDKDGNCFLDKDGKEEIYLGKVITFMFEPNNIFDSDSKGKIEDLNRKIKFLLEARAECAEKDFIETYFGGKSEPKTVSEKLDRIYHDNRLKELEENPAVIAGTASTKENPKTYGEAYKYTLCYNWDEITGEIYKHIDERMKIINEQIKKYMKEFGKSEYEYSLPEDVCGLIEKLFIHELNKAYTSSGEPTSEEAMNYFRSVIPILEKISVTDKNREAAQKKLEECLGKNKNRIKITSFYGSFRYDQISFNDFLKGIKEAKGEELSTNDVKRMSQLMKQFFTLFDKLMREIYPVREERIKMRNEIDGIKEKQ